MRWSSIAAVCLIVVIGLVNPACASQEADFFASPTINWADQLRKLSLERQIDVYLESFEHMHPPDLRLADVIAEQGKAAADAVKARIKITPFERAVLDLLGILLSIDDLKTYDVEHDIELYKAVRARVVVIVDPPIRAALERQMLLLRWPPIGAPAKSE